MDIRPSRLLLVTDRQAIRDGNETPTNPPAKKQENPTFESFRLAFSTTLINYCVCSWEILRILSARQFPERVEREQRYTPGLKFKQGFRYNKTPAGNSILVGWLVATRFGKYGRTRPVVIGQTSKIHSMDKMDDLIGILSSKIRVRNFSQLSNQSYKYLPLTYSVNEIHDNICAGYSTENVYNLCSTSYVRSPGQRDQQRFPDGLNRDTNFVTRLGTKIVKKHHEC
ncbi:predicted protein [Histoplasma capsulatum var. duboisii H88]|uniref:Predicted protein n=1 Tax=Ajellomyces capsulatus (strain H88) TaxID=544711 RepID=F0UPZ2_AJEC8|nr:predicted protein [Histoplasma capsulatum var. duboisii H88]